MIMIFGLLRPDIFSIGDIGLVKAVKLLEPNLESKEDVLGLPKMSHTKLHELVPLENARPSSSSIKFDYHFLNPSYTKIKLNTEIQKLYSTDCMEFAVYSISLILGFAATRWVTENIKFHVRNKKIWLHHWIVAILLCALSSISR